MFRVNISAFLILGAVFISALLIGGTFFYGVFFFILFLLMLSNYMGKKVYKSMECLVWKVSDKVVTGAYVDYSAEIYNSSMFPIPYMEVYLNMPERLTGEKDEFNVRSLSPGGKIKLPKSFTCQHKGIYDLGSIEVIYSDPFFIFSWKKQFKYDISLIVYPRIYPIENMSIPANQLFGTISKKSNAFEDFTSVKDIRKYNTGDSFKKIHWKVSAHKGDLYVKNLDMNASTHMHLFLDLYESKYIGNRREDIEERAAECAASLINFAMSKGIGINLYAAAKEYINLSHKEAGTLETYFDVLASLNPKGTIDISQIIYKEAQKLNSGVTIIIITPKVDTNLISTASQMKLKGFEFIILEIKDESMSSDEIERYIPADIGYIAIPLDGKDHIIVRDKYA
jgi:uncharacterized protein (DUF58 family)